MVGFNMNGPGRDRVLKLIEEKDRIESEIRDHTSILETNHVGMHDPLVDSEGFPRNDIDVYKVRHARHQIICLQNDHKNLMKLIEKGLTELHAEINASGETQSVNLPTTSSNGHINSPTNVCSNGHINSNSNTDSFNRTINDECFGTVGHVSNGSPADTAGLLEHDEILQFGSVNYENFRDMSQIMDIVGHSVGQRINVKIKRDHNIINVTVVPRPWQQPGLLGCVILRKQ